jgi:GNAT superfamily N-acetyltransferase
LPRLPLTVRDAVADDCPALLELWANPLVPLAADPVAPVEADHAAAALQRIANDPFGRIVVAELEHEHADDEQGDDRPGLVGAVYLRRGPLSPLSSDEVLYLTHLKVHAAVLRHGIGSALVDAAVAWAEEQQIDVVLTYSAADDREANRFLARLGMSHVGVVRAGAVATMRAQLPGDVLAVARHLRRQPRMVGQVVAARRSQRRLRARGMAT